jgi:tetratricopeptide (TPR) repeat protein
VGTAQEPLPTGNRLAQSTPEGEGNPVTGVAQPSRRRLWLFRLTALVLVPALVLLTLELVLRLIGFGYPTSFALKKRVAGREVYVRNADFPRRFFPEGLGRLPLAFEIPVIKPPGTFRVFILGASAAKGTPEPCFGFGRILEVQLRQRYPEIEFEVVNCAATAINSHVVLETAKDCTELDPDVFVVYLGNNEVVGPFGAGTVLAPFSPSLGAIRAGLKIKSTRIGQLLGSLVTSASRTSRPRRWEGMQMFLGNQVPVDDPALEAVYEHFRENLEDVCHIAARHEVPVILCTVATNLKDCPPFASQHRAELTDDQRQAWNSEYEQGVELEAQGDWPAAIEHYLAAAAIDGRYAALQYRLGRCYWTTEDFQSARAHFVAARHFDTLRFRADEPINTVIRDVAADWSKRGVMLVDAEKAFEEHSSHATPGAELFHEHVHLNFSGNYQLATAVLERLETILRGKTGPKVQPRAPPLNEADCAERLAYTDWDRYQITDKVLNSFIKEPPFTNQIYHDELVMHLEQQLAALRVADDPMALQQVDRQYRRALEHNPSDFWIHLNYAIFLLAASQDEIAISQQLELCLRTLPDDSDLFNKLALALVARGRLDDARRCFDQALQISPENPGLHTNLADALARAGMLDEAFAQYEAAIQLDPDDPTPYLNRGATFRSQGMIDEAIADFQQALAIEPDFAPAHSSLAAILSSQGKLGEAVEHLRRVLHVHPKDAATHHGLGVIFQAWGQLPEAMQHFQAALESNPNEPMTHNRLGQVLADLGQYDDAIEHFRTAISLKPDWAPPMAELAWVLATCRDPAARNVEEAVAWAERACPVGDCPKARFLDIRAAAYAAAGQFSDAVETAREAIARTSPEDVVESAERRRRLGLYETGRPFQPPANTTP